MEIHPLAEKYPLMDGEEYEAFKADIQVRGLENPVWRYEGKVLDGRNRLRACNELGIAPRFEDYTGDDPAGFVDSQNLHRRHLTAAFRRERVKEMRAKGMSTREIAKELGASQSQVVRDLKDSGEPHGSPAPNPLTLGERPPGDGPPEEIDPEDAAPTPEPPRPSPVPPKVTGRDGKQYPASRPNRQGAAVPRAAGAATRTPEIDPPPARPAASPPPPPEPAGVWGEVLASLTRVAELIESADRIPEGMRPWDTIKAMEKTGHALLKRATQLRRRHSR